MLLSSSLVPMASPSMSLIPAKTPMSPLVPCGLEMSTCSIVTLLGLPVRLIPSPEVSSPKLLIASSLMTALSPVTFTEPATEYPAKTAPLPNTVTFPPPSVDQPGPLEAWPGTERRDIPVGTPVLVASGYPHVCGAGPQLCSEGSYAGTAFGWVGDGDGDGGRDVVSPVESTDGKAEAIGRRVSAARASRPLPRVIVRAALVSSPASSTDRTAITRTPTRRGIRFMDRFRRRFTIPPACPLTEART